MNLPRTRIGPPPSGDGGRDMVNRDPAPEADGDAAMETCDPSTVCSVRNIRIMRGIAQRDLAHIVGINRQSLGAIESGRYVPNTAIALRIASALNCSVEDLFQDRGDILARLGGRGGQEAHPPGTPVIVACTGNRLSLYRADQSGPAIWFSSGPDAIATPGGFAAIADLDIAGRTIVALGGDPALPLLLRVAKDRLPLHRLVFQAAPAAAALAALADGCAHAASWFRAGAEDARAAAPDPRPCRTFVVAEVEIGVAVAPGNPKQVRSPGDAARADLRCQEAPGDGAPDPEAAQRVRCGQLDLAWTTRALASSLGLHFLPAGAATSLLSVSAAAQHAGELATLVEALRSPHIRRILALLPGYDSGRTGFELHGAEGLPSGTCAEA